MIMKLKSKDEIVLKLIEQTEREWNFKSNNMGSHGCDAMGCAEGKVNMLKWVLGIPQDYTKGEPKNDSN